MTIPLGTVISTRIRPVCNATNNACRAASARARHSDGTVPVAIQRRTSLTPAAGTSPGSDNPPIREPRSAVPGPTSSISSLRHGSGMGPGQGP